MNSKNLMIKYGLMMALANIIYYTVASMSRLSFENPFSSTIPYYVFYLIFPLLASLKLKKWNDNILGFGESFKLSLAIFVIAGFLLGPYIYAYLEFIDPEFIDETLKYQSKMFGTKELSVEQIKQQKEMMSSFTGSPLIIAGGQILSIIFSGVIFSLIIGAVVNNKKKA